MCHSKIQWKIKMLQILLLNLCLLVSPENHTKLYNMLQFLVDFYTDENTY